MRKIQVLLVDDSSVNNLYTEDLLKDLEQVESVTAFTNPEEALSSLKVKLAEQQQLPDLILLDIRMPEMDGYEFLEELEYCFEDDKDIPIVFILTSSQHRKDVESFERYRCAKEFLRKPLEEALITQLIKNYFHDYVA